jgi:hypothetical protein
MVSFLRTSPRSASLNECVDPLRAYFQPPPKRMQCNGGRMLLRSRSLCCGWRRLLSCSLATWRDYIEYKTKNRSFTTNIFVSLFHFSLTSPLTLIETRSTLRFVVFTAARVYLTWRGFLPVFLFCFFFLDCGLLGCDTRLHGVTTQRPQPEKKCCG